MTATEARVGRRFVGQATMGDDLVSSIAATFARAGAALAEVHASGTIEDAVVTAGEHPRHLHGPLELLSLTGMVRLDAHGRSAPRLAAVFGREGDNGIDLLGGQLVSARARLVDFVLQTLELGESRRPPAPNPESTEPAEAPAPPSWAQVVEAASLGSASKMPSASRTETPRSAPVPPEEPAESEEAPPELQVGDFLEHPKFGRGRIERVEDGEFVSVRLENGRMVRLSLEVLTLAAAGTHQGRPLYRARLSR